MAKTCAATLAIFLAAGLSAEAQEMTYGQAEFLNSCAACHGTDGHGDGPMAEVLNTPPADLTRIAARRDGVFPAKEIYRIIDGRKEVRVHGTSDMPVWGDIFKRGWPPKETREKIQNLVAYLESLQE